MKVLEVMNTSGHTTLEVGPLKQEEVDAKFEEMVKSGMLAYKETDEGNVQVRTLDEVQDAEKVIVHGQFAGG